MENIIVYVHLLNEGTTVLRPVPALFKGDNKYFLLETNGYDPEDEEWEFLPRSMVVCEKEIRDGKTILVAKALID